MNTIEVNAFLHKGDRQFEFQWKTSRQFIAIEGPSGVGKTTFLRMLAGLEHQTVGSVFFRGAVWQREKWALRPWERKVGWLSQDALLFPHFNVLANLGHSGKSTSSEMIEISRILQIETLLRRRSSGLSGGERQRIGLARALLSQPKLLLLDEPFSALEEVLRLRLMKWLRGFCESKEIGIVMVSHHADECGDLCEERWLMEEKSFRLLLLNQLNRL